MSPIYIENEFKYKRQIRKEQREREGKRIKQSVDDGDDIIIII